MAAGKMAVWHRVLVLCLVMALCVLYPVKVGAEGNPGEASFEVLHFRLPENCAYLPGDNGGSITENGRVIGGVTAFPAWADLSEWDWASKLPFPEWNDVTLGWFSSGAPGQECSVEFFSDVPPGQEQTVSTIHYLFWNEGRVYDLWFDRLTAGEGVESAIFASAGLGAAVPALPYEIGTLPEGIGILRTVGGGILFEDGSRIVAGLTSYPIPDGVYDPYDAWFLWLEDVGIPDYSDDSLFFEGGITAGENGWKVTFSNQSTGDRRTHVFHPAGNMVYDFWFEESMLSEQTQEELRRAVRYQAPAETPAVEQSESDQAFARCFAVMDAVQSGSYQIQSQCVYADGSVTTAEEYWSDAGLLRICRSETETTGMLVAEDRLFISQDPNLTWEEKPKDYEHTGPWLAAFAFQKRNVTWLDTFSNDQGEEIAFMVNYPFLDNPGTAKSYLATFFFDDAGNFREVRLEVGMLEEETRVITETIVTMDAEVISAEIQREYTRAIG